MDSENNVGAAPGTLGAVVLCRCGCECAATWLCDGYDYDPHAPGHRGQPFTSEPCCESAKAYLEDGSVELNLPFSARRIHAPNARPVRTDGPPRDSGTHEAVVGRSEDA